MKANFDMFNRREKKRIIIFIIITVIAAVNAILWVRVLYMDTYNPQYFPESTGLEIDGADFTPLISLTTSVATDFFVLLRAVIFLVFSWIMDFAVYIIFGELAFEKDTFVSNAEYLLTKWIFTVVLIISTVVSLLLAHFNHRIYIALLMFPIWLFGYLFYIHKLKYKSQK